MFAQIPRFASKLQRRSSAGRLMIAHIAAKISIRDLCAESRDSASPFEVSERDLNSKYFVQLAALWRQLRHIHSEKAF
jgi:hypothetical protein